MNLIITAWRLWLKTFSIFSTLFHQSHRLHQATSSISSTLSFPHSCVDEPDHYCLKTLTEDFLYFLNPISSLTLSSTCLSCYHATCTLCLFSLHHDDYAIFILCLYLSTYSAASVSLLRKFLTKNFLSYEFVKISYSPPLVDITHFQLVLEQGTPLFCVILV